MKQYYVIYEHDGVRYHTVVEAPDRRTAEKKFRKDNPHVEFISAEGDTP